jgi:hypothetical protein
MAKYGLYPIIYDCITHEEFTISDGKYLRLYRSIQIVIPFLVVPTVESKTLWTEHLDA